MMSLKYILCISQFGSVTQLCLTLCDPMDCSTPGFPVHHQFPELTQTHVHQVSDAIQPSHRHPLLLPPSIFPSESVLCTRWPKYWSFSFSISLFIEFSGLHSFRVDCWISLQPRGLSRVFSNTTVQKHQFLALTFLNDPTLTSIHDYWKNDSFD